MEVGLHGGEPRHCAPGARRLTDGLRRAKALGDKLCVPPDGISLGRVMAAFKAAAPELGIPRTALELMDQLVACYRQKVVQPGKRPIVWPSNETLADRLSISERQVIRRIRLVGELGLVWMKDGPNGQRRPIGEEEYGFDLSPFVARFPEFLAAAAAADERRRKLRELRRRRTIARRLARQLAAAALEKEAADLAAEGELAAAEGARVALDEAAIGSFEKRVEALWERLEQRSEEQNPSPKDDIGDTPITTTSPPLSSRAGTPQPERVAGGPEEPLGLGTVRITPAGLVELVPELAEHLITLEPGWPDIVDAAERARRKLGVSTAAWGSACVEIGRETAALITALVLARPREHFTSSPAAYWVGCVTRARNGEFDLERGYWRLFRERPIRIRRPPPSGAGPFTRGGPPRERRTE